MQYAIMRDKVETRLNGARPYGIAAQGNRQS